MKEQTRASSSHTLQLLTLPAYPSLMKSQSLHPCFGGIGFIPGFLVLLLLLVGLASPLCALQNRDFTYTSDGSAITITRYTGSGGDVSIPSQIGGVPVRIIGKSAFLNCQNLGSLTIPDGVTDIGSQAFRGCSMSAVEIPGSVTSIGDYGFCNCSRLGRVTISGSVIDIGDCAFYECSSLTDVTISEGTTSIGYEAFFNCASLVKVAISSSVTTIGDYAFSNCNVLTSATIPGGATTIGYHAFASCRVLSSVTFPEGITSIGSGAFLDCVRLEQVTIPHSVSSIEDDAFRSCSSLSKVIFLDGVENIGPDAFQYCVNLNDIVLPASLKSIEDEAFYGCDKMTSATFLGSAPDFGSVVFEFRSNFHVRFITGAAGFTAPFWEGNQTVAVDAPDAATAWRLKYFGTFDAAGSAADDADPDGDGQSNAAEFAAGTDPTNPADVFQVLNSIRDGNTFSLQVAGKAGRNYVLERNLSLDSGSWAAVSGASSGVLAADSPVTLIDPEATPSKGFYRVSVSQP